jgi:hypothetical protein
MILYVYAKQQSTHPTRAPYSYMLCPKSQYYSGHTNRSNQPFLRPIYPRWCTQAITTLSLTLYTTSKDAVYVPLTYSLSITRTKTIHSTLRVISILLLHVSEAEFCQYHPMRLLQRGNDWRTQPGWIYRSQDPTFRNSFSYLGKKTRGSNLWQKLQAISERTIENQLLQRPEYKGPDTALLIRCLLYWQVKQCITLRSYYLYVPVVPKCEPMLCVSNRCYS